MPVTRRQFLKRSAAATMGLPMVVPSTVFGASDRIRAAVIGLGSRGSGKHVRGLHSQDGVEVVAVCDPDRDRLNSSVGKIKDWYQHEVDILRFAVRGAPRVLTIASRVTDGWYYCFVGRKPRKTGSGSLASCPMESHRETVCVEFSRPPYFLKDR